MTDQYTFLSWVRDGAAALISEPETLDADLSSRAGLDVHLDVQGFPSHHVDDVHVQLPLIGPGDVTSLDRDEVLRVDPSPGTASVEPHVVPTVEFRRADLPWLFSPVTGTDATQQKLRPWLCLVVVPASEASLQPGFGARPTRLTCPVRELPDLSESWAWAHAQIVGLQDDESITHVLQHEPERTLSRLIGPRRLQPGTSYVACVVPTFQAGVEAGLGEPVVTGTLTPAWPDPSSASIVDTVVLPVYHVWSFATGRAGDFESLVRRLQPHAITAGAATRTLDVSDPGAGVVIRDDGDPAETLPIAGALASEGHVEQPWTTPAGERFEAEMREKFDRMADATTATVGPPLYGRWHAGTDRPPADGDGPHWLRDLNLDPRLRAYAALGAQTVQTHQEALMASAWEQVDEVEAVNQRLRQAQLARDVTGSVHRKRLPKLRSETLIQVTRSVHDQVTYDGATLRTTVTESDVPDGTVTGALRSMIRPAGPLVRRSGWYRSENALTSQAFVRKVAVGDVTVNTVPATARDLVVLDDLRHPPGQPVLITTESVLPANLESQRDDFHSQSFSSWIDDAPRFPALRTADMVENAFEAAIALMERQMRLDHTDVRRPSRFLDVDAVASDVTTQLKPDDTVVERVAERIESSVTTPGDPLEPILAAPSFPQPMSDVLRAMAPEWMLGGADGLPNDSVSLAQANGAFVYAYMIGLNHEMASELLSWGYPTDQRGTYFQHFWDREGFDASGDANAPVDVEPLHRLPEDLRLLGTSPDAASDRLVLVVRGALLHRFPDLWLYAAKADSDGTTRRPSAETHRAPLFGGALGEDAAYFAFDLTLAEARGTADDPDDPGWFFVFQEPPTEARFGLDETPVDDGLPTQIDDLAWTHVMDPGDRYATLAHGVLPPGATFTDARTQTSVTWGKNGAHVARCLLQRPVRIAYHADALLPAPAETVPVTA